ncbi:MAG TPA: protein translocase subunit SecF [Polyangiaceae bacterium]|jgi:preprotein translocase subunit SecF|nr:protein translocase subunit SecF [Polyangiaceae bacterium]
MQLFPVGKIYDFMGSRRAFAIISVLMTVFAAVVIVKPGPNLGTDFKGGTEIEVEFKSETSSTEITNAVEASGFSAPDVIRISENTAKNRYLIRVQEVSTISAEKQREIANALCVSDDGAAPPAGCPEDKRGTELKVSPGGDKIAVRYRDTPDLTWVRTRMEAIRGVALREGETNPTLQNARDNKVEIQIKSKGDQLLDGLRSRLGPDRVPSTALRVEWIGPKAGAQLRDSALKSIAIALVFIMVYIALRFDLRFAPGAVISLAHDALATLGLLIVMHREINLTTVAAILTVVGYSVNDTVIVYDRVRENFGLLRGATFESIINTSISEMLGRTILTSSTVVMSLLAFFIWGTGPLKDFALALIIGVVLGTYSSVYVALPFTWWLDRRFFSKGGTQGSNQARVRPTKKTASVV